MHSFAFTIYAPMQWWKKFIFNVELFFIKLFNPKIGISAFDIYLCISAYKELTHGYKLKKQLCRKLYLFRKTKLTSNTMFSLYQMHRCIAYIRAPEKRKKQTNKQTFFYINKTLNNVFLTKGNRIRVKLKQFLSG